MTGTLGASSSRKVNVDFDDPLYLHPSDNSVIAIIIFKFLGTENFRVWKSSMSRTLKAKNKIGLVDGTELKDKKDMVRSPTWDRVNVVVCSEILNSVSESIYIGHASSEFALDIWIQLNNTYFMTDGFVVFNLHHHINTLTQSVLFVSDYYNKVDDLWKEFDGLTKCTECVYEAAT